MNYRHAFHAGNFADVHKHVVLALILAHLRVKPAAFRVIDTHAGAGRYNLLDAEPSRSGEWRTGIARLWQAAHQDGGLAADVLDLLAPYLAAIAALNPDGALRIYPGSPLIARTLLRSQDRLLACELEPQSAATLKALLDKGKNVKALAIDGWLALAAYVPPKERRGLVLIDPPFEDPAEFTRLASGFAAAYRKWPSGIYMLWYPIKERAAADALARRMAQLAVPNVLRCEIMMAPPRADAGLVGSGLLVVNPPFTLERDLRIVLAGIARVLSPHASVRLDWLGRRR
jgi:23S rRNA (adenine2030-N6)-methyltransferase